MHSWWTGKVQDLASRKKDDDEPQDASRLIVHCGTSYLVLQTLSVAALSYLVLIIVVVIAYLPRQDLALLPLSPRFYVPQQTGVWLLDDHSGFCFTVVNFWLNWLVGSWVYRIRYLKYWLCNLGIFPSPAVIFILLLVCGVSAWMLQASQNRTFRQFHLMWLRSSRRAHLLGGAVFLGLCLAVVMLVMLCRHGQGQATTPREGDPEVLLIYYPNVHPVEHEFLRVLVHRAGMQMTDSPDNAHIHVLIEKDACDSSTKPVVWAGLLYNGDPMHTLERQGAYFAPWMFSHCKYWLGKKQQEIERFKRAGLHAAVVPRYVSDVDVVGGEWDQQTQNKIRGYIGFLGERFPASFYQNWKIKQMVPDVHVHGPGVGLDPMIADRDGFRDSKFTLHIKNEGGTYLCNSVLRSLAAGVPVVTDTGTFDTGLFDGIIVHKITGMVFDNVDMIIEYLRTVPDEEYRALRRNTQRHGSWVRDIPQCLVDDARKFFWQVYHDSYWQFEGSWWPSV